LASRIQVPRTELRGKSAIVRAIFAKWAFFPGSLSPHAWRGKKRRTLGQQRDRRRGTMTWMQRVSQSRTAILRRLAQLDTELRRVRAELKNLRSHDPATSEVVIRGAMLSRERSSLERRLEMLRTNPAQAISQVQ
jgi:hypothetical protein